MSNGLSGGLVPEDTTPLDPDEIEGLRLSWVSTQADLNAAEGANIRAGTTWAEGLNLTTDVLLTSSFLRDLHRHMFGNVWRWAGRYRTTEKNIGLPPFEVIAAVEDAFADCRMWLSDDGSSRWTDDEIAVRLHHRLVWIHPFPNGNGRISRLCADLLLQSVGGDALSWGSGSILDAGDVRREYVAALVRADDGEFGPILRFARS